MPHLAYLEPNRSSPTSTNASLKSPMAITYLSKRMMIARGEVRADASEKTMLLHTLARATSSYLAFAGGSAPGPGPERHGNWGQAGELINVKRSALVRNPQLACLPAGCGATACPAEHVIRQTNTAAFTVAWRRYLDAKHETYTNLHQP